MLKKRLIFTLLYKQNNFYLSRNFRLQKVGGIDWLIKNYNFEKIACSIDELVILNLSGKDFDVKNFCDDVLRITKNCFIPVSLGGGIKNIEDAEILFSNGADKIVINSALFSCSELIRDISKRYGSQSIIASVDLKFRNNSYLVFIENGLRLIDKDFKGYLNYIESLPIGEVFLNSIDKDGTGQGFQMDLMNYIDNSFSKPIIISGGAGNENHLLEGLTNSQTNAVATANLFNFIGDGLPNARKFLLESGCNLARW
jgi:cyclase